VKPGQLVADKYRVERVLGQGGMGVVVAALHVQLGHRVAIKFLLPASVAYGPTMARFEREARAAVALQSDHVSRVFDVGTLEDGSPYIVMELLSGKDLAEECHARGLLPAHEAVRYLLQACDAIAEAHGLGIIHRDIKPSNLFLAQRPKRAPVIKVLDFGISKVSEAVDGAQLHALTGTTDVVGSPIYMSPEQLRGAKNVDARSDIWSLGVTLFELVSGAPPFTGGTLAELSANILTEPAPDVRTQSANNPVSEGLAAVVARCLQKDPEARYASVDALMRALEPYAGDAPSRPSTPSPLATTPPPTELGTALTVAAPARARAAPVPPVPPAGTRGEIAAVPPAEADARVGMSVTLRPELRLSAKVSVAVVSALGAGLAVVLLVLPALEEAERSRGRASTADTRATPAIAASLPATTLAEAASGDPLPATSLDATSPAAATAALSASASPRPGALVAPKVPTTAARAPSSASAAASSSPAPSATSISPIKVTIQ